MGAFLVALRMKGETPAEIAAAADRDAPPRHPGPDPARPRGARHLWHGRRRRGQTFNISTAAALVVAGAGVTVAKHGNRSVSSRSGSADLLTACGVKVDAAGGGRRALPVRGRASASSTRPRSTGRCATSARSAARSACAASSTCSGPSPTRHARPRQLLGVYASSLVPVVAETLARLGTERALVVHGLEGLDEISPSGPTRAAWVEAGQVREVVLRPEDGGLKPRSRAERSRAGRPEDNARLLAGLLEGHDGPLRDAVLLNAGAALWVADAVETLAEGVLRAAESIDSGRRAHPAGAPGRPDPRGRGGVTPGGTDERAWRPPRGALAELVAGCPRGLRATTARATDAPGRGREPAATRPALRGRPAERARLSADLRGEARLAVGRGDPRGRRAGAGPGLRRGRRPLRERAHRGAALRRIASRTSARVRAAVDVPLLRKDFVVDPHMLAGGSGRRRGRGAPHRRGGRAGEARRAVGRARRSSASTSCSRWSSRSSSPLRTRSGPRWSASTRGISRRSRSRTAASGASPRRCRRPGRVLVAESGIRTAERRPPPRRRGRRRGAGRRER